MTAIAEGSELDRAEQRILVDDHDRDTGLDTTAMHPPSERSRTVFDTAALADRLDQNWITPPPRDDDYYYDHDHDDYDRWVR